VTKAISGMTAAGTLTGLELVEVSQLSTTVTMTATTLSADGDDNSFNDSANGFITEGFTVGMRVKATGFTGNVANNIVSGRITALTAGKMTIGGTDGDVLVDDAAGESVTITAWSTVRTTVQEVADMASTTAGLSVVITDADNYTVLAADNNKYIRLTAAGTKTVTVQTEATQALPANGEWHFRNHGAGNATLTPSGGVTLNAPYGGTLVVPQGGSVTLKRIAADAFDVIGVTVPA
jgi:hypothetical protein